jgi:hypothetical protein
MPNSWYFDKIGEEFKWVYGLGKYLQYKKKYWGGEDVLYLDKNDVEILDTYDPPRPNTNRGDTVQAIKDMIDSIANIA